MAGVQFFHPEVGQLNIRLAPTSVEYSFNLNTSVTPTYGGEVVQILSINIDKLVIKGRFGKEGPFGRKAYRKYDQSGQPYDEWGDRPVPEHWDIGDGGSPYGVGLYQMMEWFRRYFAIATQGASRRIRGRYNQQPVRLIYQGTEAPRRWLIYPISFPSFRRSLDNFAPEWMVEAEVAEPDWNIQDTAYIAEINNLRDSIGLVPQEFSDPAAGGWPEVLEKQRKLIKEFKDLIPAYTKEELELLTLFSASVPDKWGGYSTESSQQGAESSQQEDTGPSNPQEKRARRMIPSSTDLR